MPNEYSNAISNDSALDVAVIWVSRNVRGPNNLFIGYYWPYVTALPV